MNIFIKLRKLKEQLIIDVKFLNIQYFKKESNLLKFFKLSTLKNSPDQHENNSLKNEGLEDRDDEEFCEILKFSQRENSNNSTLKLNETSASNSNSIAITCPICNEFLGFSNSLSNIALNRHIDLCTGTKLEEISDSKNSEKNVSSIKNPSEKKRKQINQKSNNNNNNTNLFGSNKNKKSRETPLSVISGSLDSFFLLKSKPE